MPRASLFTEPNVRPMARLWPELPSPPPGTAPRSERTTASDGKWEIPLPGARRYTITLDVATLPAGLNPAREGGQTLRNVPVPDRPLYRNGGTYLLSSTLRRAGGTGVEIRWLSAVRPAGDVGDRRRHHRDVIRECRHRPVLPR